MKVMNINTIKENIKMEDISKGKNSNIVKIIKGSIISIIFSLVCLTIFAAVLAYTSVSETTMIPVIIVITGISILIGSSISTMHIKNKGLINGAIVGIIYVLFLYIVSSIIGMQFQLNLNSIIMMLVGIVTGMIGGIIGVNINK